MNISIDLIFNIYYNISRQQTNELSMTYIEFLVSEYNWCMKQYARLGFAHYMMRAMILEDRINQYYEVYNDQGYQKAA